MERLIEFHNTSIDYLLGLTDEIKQYPKKNKKNSYNQITRVRIICHWSGCRSYLQLFAPLTIDTKINQIYLFL